jgi:hypothetical protein
MSTDRFDIARRAAVTWMARNGVTSDRYSYESLNRYADDMAYALVLRAGTPRAIVNGMELITSPFGDYVVTR